jgi:hypothetical protein
MVRQRDLLSLVDIADETGISYATLRNYALKYGKEIPSEGSGRSTRYPRAAVKVFQRLRKESKPGRKPASALATQAPAVARPEPPELPERKDREEAAPRFSLPAALPKTGDNSGIERELAAIRTHLGSIAESLSFLISSSKNAALAAPVEPAVPATVEAPAPAAPDPAPQAAPGPQGKETRETKETEGGHRRLHSMPKVWGQRGKRPD